MHSLSSASWRSSRGSSRGSEKAACIYTRRGVVYSPMQITPCSFALSSRRKECRNTCLTSITAVALSGSVSQPLLAIRRPDIVPYKLLFVCLNHVSHWMRSDCCSGPTSPATEFHMLSQNDSNHFYPHDVPTNLAVQPQPWVGVESGRKWTQLICLIPGRVRTKTVKKSAKVIIERYYPKLTLDVHPLYSQSCVTMC